LNKLRIGTIISKNGIFSGEESGLYEKFIIKKRRKIDEYRKTMKMHFT